MSAAVTPSPASHDVEKSAMSASSASIKSSYAIYQGRPDVPGVLTRIVDSADGRERIVVAACGPDELMEVTRKTMAGCISVRGPSVEFHGEQFGW